MKTLVILFGIIAMTACTSRPTSSITAVTVTASQVALRELGSSQLQASVFGTGEFDPAVTWSLEPSGSGTLSSGANNSVLYTAPVNSAGRVVRISATSVQADKRQQTVYLSINPRQTSIAGGGAHTLALKQNGTMLAWGWDADGQLGDNIALEPKALPVAVNPASDIVAIAAGGLHSLALRSDGTMLAWGSDQYGQLGNDAPLVGQATPKPVATASDVVAIAAGNRHSLALKVEGSLLAWGADINGELGNNAALEDAPVPVSVLLGANLIRVP